MVSGSTVPRKDSASLGLEANSMSSPEFGRHVIDKISRHLLWFLFLLFVFSFLDRINIGFAGLTMVGDLGLTATQFGLATTLFYVAYIACGIPSNMILARVGARKWIGSIMIAWGLASTATMFATDANTLYLLRILVGITEAGFLPGMLLYLTFWFPNIYRARANALFMIAMPITSAVASVLSGYLLSLDGTLGLKGWQWLFLVEGLPSVVLGFVVFYYLDDTPEKATWLKAEEKRYLTQTLVAEHKADPVLEPGQQKKSLLSELTSAHGHQIRGGLLLPGEHPGHGRGLDAADRQEFQRRREQHHDRPAGGHSAGLHDHRHDLVGTALRSQAGTQVAHRVADAVLRRRLAAHGFFRQSGHPVAGHLPRLDRLLHGHVGILDDPGSRPQFPGEGGWHRGDQRHRQHRIRPEPGGRGMVEGSHPDLHDRPALRGRTAGHRGLCGSDAANPVSTKASLK